MNRSEIWGHKLNDGLTCRKSVLCPPIIHGFTFSSHAQTLGAFNRECIKKGCFPPEIFRKVQRLFEDRQVADYDWNISIEAETAAKDLSDAKWLVFACRDYLIAKQAIEDTEAGSESFINCTVTEEGR